MADEYRARFAPALSIDETDRALRSVSGWVSYDRERATHSYRLAQNRGAMPNVDVRIVVDAGGNVAELAVWDHGSGRAVLREIERALDTELEALE